MLLNYGVGEDSWESLGQQGDPTDHPKGNQSWIFIGRTEAEVETPIVWPSDAKNWLIGKDPDAGEDWRQEEKGTTEDEMVWWHHWLDGLEFQYWPTDCVSIYLLVDIWVVSTFWLLYIMVLWTGCTNNQWNSCCKLFWVHSGKWNCMLCTNFMFDFWGNAIFSSIVATSFYIFSWALIFLFNWKTKWKEFMNHDISFGSVAPVDGLLKQLRVVCSGFSVL